MRLEDPGEISQVACRVADGIDSRHVRSGDRVIPIRQLPWSLGHYAAFNAKCAWKVCFSFLNCLTAVILSEAPRKACPHRESRARRRRTPRKYPSPCRLREFFP